MFNAVTSHRTIAMGLIDPLSQTEGVTQASVGMNIRGILGRIRFNL
jgi:hypothetical protein